jgi:hypothetical protein
MGNEKCEPLLAGAFRAGCGESLPTGYRFLDQNPVPHSLKNAIPASTDVSKQANKSPTSHRRHGQRGLLLYVLVLQSKKAPIPKTLLLLLTVRIKG